MKCVIKRCDKDFATMADMTFEDIQNYCGGYVESVPFIDNVVMLVNEEGKLLGLPYNFHTKYDIIVGNVVFVGVDEEDFCDLDHDDAERIIESFGGTVHGM